MFPVTVGASVGGGEDKGTGADDIAGAGLDIGAVVGDSAPAQPTASSVTSAKIVVVAIEWMRLLN